MLWLQTLKAHDNLVKCQMGGVNFQNIIKMTMKSAREIKWWSRLTSTVIYFGYEKSQKSQKLKNSI